MSDVSAEDTATPQTGDLVVDSALRDLAGTKGVADLSAPGAGEASSGATAAGAGPAGEELDGILARGENVHRTLTSRLSDLGT